MIAGSQRTHDMLIHPKHAGLSWQQKVDAASQADEVVEIAREFLARFDPLEMQRLPVECRPPGKLYDGSDIGSYALDLVRHGCEAPGEAMQLLQSLEHFFSHASMRIAQLGAG
jgi:hypothetical protein